MWKARAPRWLSRLEWYFGWIAVPNIAVLFVTLQALGFLMVSSDPAWVERLALVPKRVMEGEYWRLITFLSLPSSTNIIFMLFALGFIYFTLNLVETFWGAFKTTLYVLMSVLLTISFSLYFDYPVIHVTHFESTLFFAAAALQPEMEVRLYLALPLKIKWLAWFTGFFVLLQFFNGTWMDRLFLITIYSNFLVFFGPAQWERIRLWQRRKKFQRDTQS